MQQHAEFFPADQAITSEMSNGFRKKQLTKRKDNKKGEDFGMIYRLWMVINQMSCIYCKYHIQ